MCGEEGGVSEVLILIIHSRKSVKSALILCLNMEINKRRNNLKGCKWLSLGDGTG